MAMSMTPNISCTGLERYAPSRAKLHMDEP